MRSTVLALTVASLFACSDDRPARATIVRHYTLHVHGMYTRALLDAVALQDAAQKFVATPSEQTLAAARTAWKTARAPYGQTEAFRFYDGPIDGDNGPEGQINGWPLDEGYIDYVNGSPQSGIVNDPGNPITPKDLATYNEGKLGGMFERDKAISTGYHAIEFLLWGQDSNATGPGARPASDYETAPNAVRRGQYLLAATALLVSDLETLVAAWAPDADNYRRAFEADEELAIHRMFTGIAFLSKKELASERIDVALQNHDQEDEHSCFSDNTKADLVGNATGILNVWRGLNAGETGPSLYDLVAADDKALADSTDGAIKNSLALVTAIPDPFDQVIVDPESAGWQTADQAVDSLFEQGNLLLEAAHAVGAHVHLPDPQAGAGAGIAQREPQL